eukprot:5178110-Alexandrium_andersonii.AAC.1
MSRMRRRWWRWRQAARHTGAWSLPLVRCPSTYAPCYDLLLLTPRSFPLLCLRRSLQFSSLSPPVGADR